MNFPAELKYSKSHEWVRMDGEIAVVGISDFAQDALGDVVFINLPAEGDAVTAGESFGDVESVKAVSDIISPISGTICAVNEALADAPETLNSEVFANSESSSSERFAASSFPVSIPTRITLSSICSISYILFLRIFFYEDFSFMRIFPSQRFSLHIDFPFT